MNIGINDIIYSFVEEEIPFFKLSFCAACLAIYPKILPGRYL